MTKSSGVPKRRPMAKCTVLTESCVIALASTSFPLCSPTTCTHLQRAFLLWSSRPAATLPSDSGRAFAYSTRTRTCTSIVVCDEPPLIAYMGSGVHTSIRPGCLCEGDLVGHIE